MNRLSTGDLQFKYSWTTTASDDPNYTKNPDKVLVNRKEGYEVLYFLNAMAKKYSLTKDEALALEEALHKVPGNLRSRENIEAWLVDNEYL